MKKRTLVLLALVPVAVGVVVNFTLFVPVVGPLLFFPAAFGHDGVLGLSWWTVCLCRMECALRDSHWKRYGTFVAGGVCVAVCSFAG